MAISMLDPKTALIIVDLQKGIVSRLPKNSIDKVIDRAGALAKSFRKRGLPVVLVNVTGMAPGRTEQPRHSIAFSTDWAEIILEMNIQPTDILVTKQTWGAFTGTDLGTQLRAMGVTQVVIAGVATGTGVESTARQAYELGFNVALAVDAMTDIRLEAHEYSVKNIFPRLGETGVVEEIIEILTQRSS